MCGRALTGWTPVYGGVKYHQDQEWRHPMDEEATEDHAPVPVPYKDIPHQQRGRCDFCHAESPGFIVPVRSFTPDYGPDVDRPDDMTVANWSACGLCATYVRKGRWDALAQRAVTQISAHQDVPRARVREHVLRLQAQVRKNMTGKPFRLEGPLT